MDWVYQDYAKVPEYQTTVSRNQQTYRIRAVHDSNPMNPVTDGDCNWPIIVRSPDKVHDLTCYEFGEERNFHLSLSMLTDAALVHNQVHIAKLLGSTVYDLYECYDVSMEYEGQKYIPDGDILRHIFDQAVADRSMRDVLDVMEQLYRMAGWPAWKQEVRGYCQGDWAEVLVVATKEARDKFGCTEPPWDEDLKSTAELYGHWAFGDVYGYIVERRATLDCRDEDDGTHEDWEKLESCWGYYGPDFAESGLEEAALECIPDEELIDV